MIGDRPQQKQIKSDVQEQWGHLESSWGQAAKQCREFVTQVTFMKFVELHRQHLGDIEDKI